MPQSGVKRTAVQDSAIRNSCSTYSLSDVGIILLSDEKIFAMVTSKVSQNDAHSATKHSGSACHNVSPASLMPMTHAAETGARKLASFSGASFIQSGAEFFFWRQILESNRTVFCFATESSNHVIKILSCDWSLFNVIAESIARSARRRYLIYSEADFEVFAPQGQHVAPTYTG